MALRLTIDSDEEVSLQDDDSEDEGGDEAEEDLDFDFDDGTSLSRNKTKKESVIKNIVKRDDTEDIGLDLIRDMPHAEDRAIRAQEKAKKKSKEVDTNDGGMDQQTEASYFDSVIEDKSGPESNGTMFSELNLSRSLLRAVEACGYVNPTPVQAQVIPYALAGRDICASAITGSGKTAAFALPFLERLLFRPREISATRVLVVTPTRELASQIYSVILKLTAFTDITCALITGGKKDIRSQESSLRNRPDVVIGTPGRIIDHLRNSRSVTLDDLDVLVLDEVDRLLDLGFKDELEEIVRYCPLNRQTMLFSATMTSGVDDLVKLSLKRPIRIKTLGDATTVAPKLIQEFVRVRHEDEREAMLAALICRNFNQRIIVFFETKKDAHRFYVLLTLLDPTLTVCELHGDLTQPQRESALQRFTNGLCEIMIATDVAARGLDISSVQTILNAEMPRSTSTYVHRVGRTARAGKNGRAVTLVTDARRKVMKDLLKSDVNSNNPTEGGEGTLNVLSRTIPPAVITHYISKIASLETDIAQYILDESFKNQTDTALREVERAENILVHEEEIQSRPARTWHQTETQKERVKEMGRVRALEEIQAAREGLTLEELTLAQRAEKMRQADEYLDDDDLTGGKTKVGSHRMSRKKKRRIEALKEIVTNDTEMKMIAKRHKISERAGEKKEREKTGAELGLHRKSKKTDNDAKIFRPVIAVGGLDQDMNDWRGGGGTGGAAGKSLKRQLKREQEEKFTEFDPNKKLRKGGKLGNASFKSKSRFKRR